MRSDNEKLNFKAIFPVLLIVLVDLMALTIIIPLLPLYATSFGASAATIGLLGAAYPVMQFIGAPLLGALSDRYGRRPVLIVSQIGTFLSLLLLGTANALPLLFVARMMDGLTGGNISTAHAVITDRTTEKTRTAGLGLIGAAFGIGFTFGPVIAFIALALSGNNYHVPALVAAGFSLASIILTATMLQESLPPEKRGHGTSHSRQLSFNAIAWALRQPQIGILLLLLFAQQLAFGGFEQMLTLFTLSRLGLNASGNALIFVFIGILIVLVQGKFIGDWNQRWGERRLVYIGLLSLGIGLVLIGMTPQRPVNWYDREAMNQDLTQHQDENAQRAAEVEHIDLPPEENKGWLGVIWLLAAMIPTAIGGGLLRPTLNSLLTQRVIPQEVGSIMGVSAAFISGANALGPALAGVMFQTMGAPAPFVFGGILVTGLFLLAVRSIAPLASETQAQHGAEAALS